MEIMHKTYGDFLSNKSVVIVGPAPHMKNSNHGNVIDSYDIVCRINKALHVTSLCDSDIGKKTDVLYSCLDPQYVGSVSKEILIKNNVKYVCCSHPYISPFDKFIDNYKKEVGEFIPLNIINKQLYDSLLNKLKSRPNTGFSAIMELLSFDISELHICGITFYQKGCYHQGYYDLTSEQEKLIPVEYGTHNQISQIKVFKELLLSEKRITLDEELKKIVGNI